ncbi:MAG: hypothetical protein R3236_02910 [Phycisphaeraceae bacterium]|nr:hypothetical protein [Phycisphaeraceae bacterium]
MPGPKLPSRPEGVGFGNQALFDGSRLPSIVRVFALAALIAFAALRGSSDLCPAKAGAHLPANSLLWVANSSPYDTEYGCFDLLASHLLA